MKRFISKTIIFSVLIIVAINLLLFLAGRHNQFIGGIKLKHQLLEKTQSPKIIIVGGSGAGFSIDSKMIKEETGIKTINMGLFAQFGLHYLLEEIMDDIKKNDIVVLTPEYHQFYYFFNGWRGFNELTYVYPQALLKLRSKEQYKMFLSSFPRFWIGKLNSIDLSVFKPVHKNTLYNNHGDYIAHLKDTTKHDIESRGLFHDFIDTSQMQLYNGSMDILNDYTRKIKEKGAFLIFSYPTIPDKQFHENSQKINEVKNMVTTQADFEIINTPNSEIQPINDFYNTVYHLRKDGRAKRTSRLINQILESTAYNNVYTK